MKYFFIHLPAILAHLDFSILNSPVLQMRWQLLEDSLNVTKMFISFGSFLFLFTPFWG